MACNAEDNWDFTVADVVAAIAPVLIGPNHAAPGEANPGAVLQAKWVCVLLTCSDVYKKAFPISQSFE
jgi:hypothetical protein